MITKIFFAFLIIAFTSGNRLVGQRAINIIPQPASTAQLEGEFVIDHSTTIFTALKDAELMNVASRLNDILKIHLNFQLKIKDIAGSRGGIRLICDPSISGAEAYKMLINKSQLEIRGRSAAGIFYGLQSLRQLLPVTKARSASLPGMKIDDEPQLKWRGMHLDVGRHFFSKDEILKYLDHLAMYKLNVFHWHLTEDQGWRIEIKKYPRLTEVGAWRAKVGFQKNQERGLNVDNGKPYGGFYTQAEVKEIVAYAAKRYITVIPEIEMPGHSLAAMTAYPELCCFPDNIKVLTEGGVTTNIYCAGKEESFTFLENVLSEIFELFPSQYVHIGGDEAHKDKWKICPLCQKRIKEEGLKDEAELQTWFVNRIEKFLNGHGKRLLGWDEILGDGLAPNAVVMAWRGAKAAKDAAKMGNDAIFAVGWPMYFSDGQNNGEDGPGVSGGNTLMKVYNCEPVPDDLTAKEKEHLLGVQACIWTERLPKFEHVEYMLFPRICALSEVAWSKAEKNWSNFYDKLAVHEKLLDKYAINYSKRRSYTIQTERKFLPEKKGITLTMIPEVKNPIYYTVDGSDPDKNSKIYAEPLFINKTCAVKACIFDEKGKTDNINTNNFLAHQAVGLKVGYSDDFAENDKNGLTDGQLNDWSQFELKDLDARIDLGEIKYVQKISASFKECTFKRQFLPKYVNIFVSEDGINFEKIKTYTNNTFPESRKEPNTKENVTVKVGKKVRHIQLFAKNPGPVRGESKLKGEPTKILIDEIIVD